MTDFADISAPVPAARQSIQQYGDGGFIVSGTRYDGAVLISATRCQPLNADTPQTLISENIDQIIDQMTDNASIFLLGTGERMIHPDRDTRQRLRDAGIGVEPMDTGAACRTYNVLLAEERAVTALLFPVD